MNDTRPISGTAARITAGGSHGHVVVDAQRCTGCRCCEIACSLRIYGECNTARGRIYVARSERDGVIVTTPITCQQCETPLCLEMCPAVAISRDPGTDAVVVDPEKCIGCRTCVEACPFGAPSVDPRTRTSEKCNLCGGDPVCVKACPERALSFVSADEEGPHRKRAGVQKYLEELGSRLAVKG